MENILWHWMQGRPATDVFYLIKRRDLQYGTAGVYPIFSETWLGGA